MTAFRTSAILVALSLMAGTASAEDCSYSEDRSIRVDAKGVTKVLVDAGPGDLEVVGKASADVRASGRACASSKKDLDSVRIESRRDGDTVYITATYPDIGESLFGFFSASAATLDMTVLVPSTVHVVLTDSSGSLEISEVQSASIDDSSGDQWIHDIASDLEVDDSSGNIEIEAVGGNIRVRDNSGDIEIETVQGDVEIERDSSGNIDIEKVAGDVRIGDDSSGDIEINTVQRDVIIESDSSGNIRVARVSGDFTVDDDGSGYIHHSRVMRKVRVPEK